MQTDYDNSLQSYFTDMDRPRDMFKEFVASEKLPKRLIVFHGVGGVGKSSLLRMFRLHCKNMKIPVALASGDDAKSALDVVTRWTEDLKGDGVKFAAFSKTLESYRAIQAQVEDQVRQSQNRVADIASKAASKTAETAGGALLGAAIGSVIPGIGTAIGGALGGVVSGMGAEALSDWLRGFLSKPDIDLLLDPAKKLSSDFIEDLAKAAERKRVALLLDTFEQMSTLEDWAGETAQKIHPNVLVVIAGRKLPDWQRIWQGWMIKAQVEELKPMTEDVMYKLIERYYATMRGGEPDPAQVDTIIKFARGLPMVVTSAVQLWVKYGMEDFHAVKAEIVANLVDRLMEGVPGALLPALEAAAVVRWFDQPILRAVMNKEDVRDVYNELRRFPFVRTRVEGLALHDSVREMMDENLRVQDSERHAELHERAAVYFEKKLEKAKEEAQRLGLERLYHRVRADEETGIKLFQEIAEELRNNRFVNNMRALLNDVNAYPLEHESSKLWRAYYGARLKYLDLHTAEVEEVYKEILTNDSCEPKLLAYTLCSLGAILSKWQRLGDADQTEKVSRMLKQSLGIVPLDKHLVTSINNLGQIAWHRGDWNTASMYIEKMLGFSQGQNDSYELTSAYIKVKAHYAQRGDWKRMIAAEKKAVEQAISLPQNSHLRSRVLGWTTWVWAWVGRYFEFEQNIRIAMDIVRKLDDNLSLFYCDMSLGLLLGRQDKFEEAVKVFQEGIRIITDLGEHFQVEGSYIQGFLGTVLTRQGKLDEAEENLLQSLSIRQKFQITPDIPEVFIWLGQLQETRKDWKAALNLYEQSLELKWTGRLNFICEALVGICRTQLSLKNFAAIPPPLAEAEQLAQHYEYNDHLASLRLTQGHLISSPAHVLQEEKSLSALDYYKQAMIYGLRYNRFLLDELLSERPQGTPLRPIIPYCLERGEEGKKILSALCDWWQTGINDIGTPRPDTISPIPEGIPLLEAEKLARQREPGDGSIQRTVVQQIEAVIRP